MNKTQTKKLWLEDSELYSLTTTIEHVLTEDTVTKIFTKESIAFPGGGGQSPDKVTIDGLPPLEFAEDEDCCWFSFHTKDIDEQSLNFSLHYPVTMAIDAQFRNEEMAQHSGQHLISAVLYRNHGIDTVSFHLGGEDATIDVNGDLSVELLQTVESQVNELARSGARLQGCEIAQEQLDTSFLRKAPPPVSTVRVVTINQDKPFDAVACCGTHYRSAFKTLPIVLLSGERVKKKTRIHFLCGERATDFIFRAHSTLRETSTVLNVPAEKIPQRARDILKENGELKHAALQLEISSLSKEALANLSDRPLIKDSYRYIQLQSETLDPKNGGRVLTELLKTKGIVVLLSLVSREKTTLLLGCSETENGAEAPDCAAALKAAFETCKGKGGGTLLRAQGFIPSNHHETAKTIIKKELGVTKQGAE